MKRFISMVMTVVLFTLCLPTNVVAEALHPLPTVAELSAALALTGLTEDAPAYHSGMTPSYTMTALQMAGWIAEFQQNEVNSIMDSFQDYDLVLYATKESDPVTYNRLQSSYAVDGVETFYDQYSFAREWADEVGYYKDRLSALSSEIYVLGELLQGDEELTERDQVICAYEMQKDWQELRQLLREAVDRSTDWRRTYTRYEHLLVEPEIYEGDEETLHWMLSIIDEADGSAALSGALRTMTVSASAVQVKPDQTVQTRLARLSPISSALADADQSMSVMVLDDKMFVIGFIGAQNTPIDGATVTVAEKDKNAVTKVTDRSGYVSYPMRDYVTDVAGEIQINLTVKKDGYRALEADGVWLTKGAALKIPALTDDGTPYPISWSFWGHDLLLADYTVVTSPFNDTTQPLTIKVSSGSAYTLKMYFTDAQGNQTLTVGTDSGKAGTNTHTFQSDWLKRAPAGGKLYAEITANGQTHTYQAKLVLKAATVTKPIGDPNFKLLTSPGIQFTLPNSWPKPLGGLTIALNTPLDDKFAVRAYVDLNGNGAITLGTTAFDDKVKEMNDGLWKSQDQKAMDRAMKEAEKKGTFAKAKAASGGDWEGRKKYNPLKLGKISVSMSWFGFAQVQFRETKEDKDYWQVLGKGGAGFTLTVTGSWGLTWPVVDLSIALSLSATIFPEIAVFLDCYWPSGQFLPTVKKFDYFKGTLNIIIRLELRLTLCVGIKYIFSVSIIGLGYLEFVMRLGGGFELDVILQAGRNGEDLSKYRRDGTAEFTLYGGANFTIVVEILWTKTTYQPFGTWRWRLLPTPVQRAEQQVITPTDRFLAWLISTASADDASPETEGDAMQVDTSNGDLAIEPYYSKTSQDSISKSAVVALRPVGSSEPVPVLIYLYNREKALLNAQCLLKDSYVISPIYCKNDLSGSEEISLTPSNGYSTIDFDWWVADVSDISLPYRTVRSEAAAKTLQDVLFVSCIVAKDFHNEVETLSDGTTRTVRVPDKTWAFVSCYVLDGDRLVHFQTSAADRQYEYFAVAFETQGSHADSPQGSPHVKGDIVLDENGDPRYDFMLLTGSLRVDGGLGDPVYNRYFRGECYTQPALKAMSSTIMRDLHEADPVVTVVDQLGAVAYFDDTPLVNRLSNLGYVGYGRMQLLRATNEEESLYHLESVYPYQTERYIRAYDVLSMAVRGSSGNDDCTAFFLQRDSEDAGYRLMGISQPILQPYTITDYDVDMPGTDIYWMRLYGRECVYWVETAGQTEDGKHGLFKVRAMWYDETANSLSEPFDIATVQTDSPNSTPVAVRLLGDSTGYYCIRQADGKEQYHLFRFQLVMGTRLVANILSSTLATPGSYDDMSLTLYNNGNVPLTGMDLIACQEKDGQTDAFETIHLDFLDDSRNTVILRKGLDGSTEERTSALVARGEKSSLASDYQDYHYVQDDAFHYNGQGDPISTSKRLMTFNLMMPGDFVCYTISLDIPQSWSGSNSIYLQVENLYTQASTSFAMDTAGADLLKASGSGTTIVMNRDGSIRTQQSGGGLLLGARADSTDTTDYSAMFKAFTADRIYLDVSRQDLGILASRWENSDGTPMVTINLTNRAYIDSGDRNSNVVTLEAFLDDEATPVFRYSLPDEVSDRETWTLELPLALLTGGRSASKVRLCVGGKQYLENGVYDNVTEVWLEGDKLLFLTQPVDAAVTVGSQADFEVTAVGGLQPYHYQWQVKMPDGTWADLPGETRARLSLIPDTVDMNGGLYRCVVTDANGSVITSASALLTVYEVPKTGDSAPLVWWLLGAGASALALVLLIRKGKKKDEAPE